MDVGAGSLSKVQGRTSMSAISRRAGLRAASLLCVLAGVLAGGPISGAAATALPPVGERYGINGSDLLHAPAEVRARGLAVLRAGGVRSVRVETPWTMERSQPDASGNHDIDWTGADDTIGALAAAGLRPYLLIDYSAPWASTVPGDPFSRPRDPAQFATFAALSVARYGSDGEFWRAHPELPALPATTVEVWNEQNSARFWHEQATAPADYGRLLRLTQAAIRAQSPTTRIVAGGLVDRDAGLFLKRMFDAEPDLADTVDGYAYHPYLMVPDVVIDRIRMIRSVLDARGANAATIELTEIGWSLLEMSDTQRGEYLAEISRLTLDPALRVSRIIPFAAMGSEADAAQWGDWFGLLNRDGTPKQSFTRWSSELKLLSPDPLGPTATAARASGSTAADAATRVDGSPAAAPSVKRGTETVRLLNTLTTQQRRALKGGRTIRLRVAGVGGLPTTLTSATLRLTVTGASRAGTLRAWGCTAKGASARAAGTGGTGGTVGFRPGRSAIRKVTVRLGRGRALCLTSTRAVHLIADAFRPAGKVIVA
jgi:hypothetical protein